MLFFCVSVYPLLCLGGCDCYYSVAKETNTINCSFSSMTKLPNQVLPRAEQLIMNGNNLHNLHITNKNLLELKLLDLENTSLRSIDEASFNDCLQNNISLKLSNNNLQHVPPITAAGAFKANIWLSGNPFECNCDMMWMRDWLQNASNVMDKEQIKCGPGRYQGEPNAANGFQLLFESRNAHLQSKRCLVFSPGKTIYNLNQKSMGCLTFPSWIGITIGSVVILVIVVIIVINRKWEAIKFFLFMRLNVSINDDPPEEVDKLDFDAFVIFRYGQPNFHFCPVTILISLQATLCLLQPFGQLICNQ